MSFVGYTCWTQKDADALLKNEALEGKEALFLATHHPISDFQLGGSRAALVQERTERGLLTALTRAENRHVFCVVEGEPGSGKSHLIRWLHVKWPDRGARDLVLLIQRADGSLEGTLQSLRSMLPEAYQSIFDGLGPDQQFTPEGRRENFQNKLATSMKRETTTLTLPDAAWCDEREIAAILRHERALELWGAPRRILQILSGKGSATDTRDQELARFTLQDVVEIGQMNRGLRGLPFAASRWLRKLKQEADTLQGLFSEVTEAELEARQSEFPESFGLLAALNLRLNNAIQELLGSSARELDKLFRTLRQRLHTEGRRLVLLLEDVTNFQGVDEKLIDALVFNADTQTKNIYCDLISVLGVTPDYYRRYIETKSNYAQRITQHIKLLSGRDEDADALHGSTVSFATRYLRAIRAGQEHLARFDGEGEVFNRCDGCEHRATCHQVFGAKGGVGLYPFTERALTQMFSELRDPNHAMTQQTPRGLIQNILNPTLLEPEVLQRGEYPHPRLETTYLPKRDMEGPIRNRISHQETGRQEPLRRLISWWGEPSSVLREGIDERGNPLYQQVPRGVFEAFGLPWLGAAGATMVAPTPSVNAPETSTTSQGENPSENSHSPEPVPQPTSQNTSPPDTPNTSGPSGAGGTDRSREPQRPTSRWELTVAQLKARRGQLSRWMDGTKALEDGPGFWNVWLHRLMMVEVPWRRMGISPWLQATLFTESRVMLAGTKQTREHFFVINKTNWLRDGLEAFLTLQTRPLPNTDLDYHRYRLVRLVRRLEMEIKRHVRVTLAPAQGLAWTPTGIVVQAALVRAWLRGTLRPGQPLVDQWAYLFDVEPSAEASPKKRVESWVGLSTRTATLPRELELRLSHMVNQPQGVVSPGLYGACDLGMADPSEALAAMKELLEGLEFSTIPSQDRVKWDNFLASVIKMVEDMHDLPQVPRREGRRLLESARTLEESCPGEALEEFARRVQEVVTQLSDTLPSAPNDAIQGWTVRHREESQRGLLALEMKVRRDRLDDFKVDYQGTSLDDFSSQAALLDWCIQAPADDLQAARELVQQADSSLKRLLAHAEDVLEGASEAGGVTLQQLHNEGAALQTTCSSLLNAIREET